MQADFEVLIFMNGSKSVEILTGCRVQVYTGPLAHCYDIVIKLLVISKQTVSVLNFYCNQIAATIYTFNINSQFPVDASNSTTGIRIVYGKGGELLYHSFLNCFLRVMFSHNDSGQ